MNKIVFFTLMTFLIIFGNALTASAQLGLQAGLVVPVGDWSYPSSPGFGGQAFYKKNVGDDIKVGGSVGLFSFQEIEKDQVLAGDHTQLPILITFDYTLSPKLYVGADAGYTIFNSPNWLGTGFAPASSIALLPKAGLKLGDWSLEGRFNVIEDMHFAALLGYSFGG